MTGLQSQAGAAVAQILARAPATERAEVLRAVLAHAAAGLVLVEGGRAAAESVYRLADAVADRAG